jgi:plasmid stabilization system protein ParE
VLRQFRYYLVTLGEPDLAVRFRDAFRQSVESLRPHPLIGPRLELSNPRLQNLRSWPIRGFEAIRIYYLLQKDAIQVVRILHGKRDVKRLLEPEQGG